MSPPEKPAKRPPPREDPEGIDLSDFDGEAQKVAGLDLREKAKVPAPAPVPRAAAAPVMAVDLPEADASAPAHEADRSRAAPRQAQAAPPVEPSAPPPEPPRVEAAPPAAAPPPPAPPEAVPEAAAAPAAEAAPPPPSPRVPRPAPASTVTITLPPAYPGQAAPYSPPGYAPYGWPTPYAPYGAPAYPPMGLPPYTMALPPRPAPSATVEGLARLQLAATFALGYFALAALHRTFAALSGVTDIPGGAQGAGASLLFASFFFTACEGAAAALALAACSSAVLRLRESKAEPRLPAPAPGRRPLLLLAASLAIPLGVGLVAWLHMSAVQASLPTTANMTDLAYASLFEEYRTAALAVALASLGSAFLIVLGLRAALAHLSPLMPRRDLRNFGRLFVLGSAAHAATLLVLLFAAVNAPTRGQALAAQPAFLALVAGPALAALAFWRLRIYLTALHGETERRHADTGAAAAQP